MSIELTKEQKLALIYRHTHPDYRGIAGPRWGGNEGKLTLMINTPSGCNALILLDDLSDADIAAKLPYALRKEEKQLADVAQNKAVKDNAAIETCNRVANDTDTTESLAQGHGIDAKGRSYSAGDQCPSLPGARARHQV